MDDPADSVIDGAAKSRTDVFTSEITESKFILEETVAEPDYALINSVSKIVTVELPTTLQKPEKTETATTTEDPNVDLYEPAADEGVDDEATMEEEERNGVADEEEVDELERLGEMPLEDLLRMYGTAVTSSTNDVQPIASTSKHQLALSPTETAPSVSKQIAEDIHPSTSAMAVNKTSLS